MLSRQPLSEKSKVPVVIEVEDEELGLHVESLRMSQGLSEEFRLEFRVKHARDDLSVPSLIGRRCVVTFTDESNVPALKAVCTEARLLSSDFDGGHYALVVEPRTAFLRLRRDHRVFKDSTAMALATALVEPLASRVGALHEGDAATLPIHEYRVQYGETDLHAFKRFLAEDGVVFVYDLTRDTEVLLSTDTTTLAMGERTIPFVAGASLATGGGPVVTRVALHSRETIRRVRVGDDWMDRPDFDAAKESGIAPAGDKLEHYAFEHGFANTEAELERQAELRLLEHVVPAHVIEVETNTLLLPGMSLLIENPPVRAASAPLMVVSIESEWSASEGGARTWHRARCIRKDQRWVPPRLEKARVAGIHRATVVGEGEIDTDEFGRVLCAFDWDRDRRATRRVEVSQAWAGAGYGLIAHPRVGHEVLIAYLDGDPDEPVVVGRVHNGKNRHSVMLPDQKTMSVWRSKSTPESDGFNEIGMEDAAGAELLWMHAQQDLEVIIERDATAVTTRDYTFTSGRDAKMSVGGHTDVRCGMPATWKGVDLDIDASGLFKLTCGTRQELVKANYVRSVGGNFTSFVVGNHASTAGSFTVTASTAIHLMVPGAVISMTPGKIVLAAGASVIEIGGTIKMTSPLIDLNP